MIDFNELQKISIETLIEVAQDKDAPAAARGAAAANLAEISGLKGKNAEAPPAPSGKGLNEMSIPELDALIRSVEAKSTPGA
jgi:hypothetical protein